MRLIRGGSELGRWMLLGLLLPWTVFAADADVSAALQEQRPLVEQLREGGYVVYFRHAATDHSVGDQHPLNFADCSTQRNLTEKGRQQARAIGAAFRRLNLPVGLVVSSPYCRCRETAELAFGETSISNNLYFAMGTPASERRRLGEYLLSRLATPPQPGTNTVIVSHTANLKEAVNIWPEKEGGAYLFQPADDGTVRYVGTVDPGVWPHL